MLQGICALFFCFVFFCFILLKILIIYRFRRLFVRCVCCASDDVLRLFLFEFCVVGVEIPELLFDAVSASSKCLPGWLLFNIKFDKSCSFSCDSIFKKEFNKIKKIQLFKLNWTFFTLSLATEDLVSLNLSNLVS